MHYKNKKITMSLRALAKQSLFCIPFFSDCFANARNDNFKIRIAASLCPVVTEMAQQQNDLKNSYHANASGQLNRHFRVGGNPYNKQSKGFTLIEMVIAITILGIVGGLSALIINRTVDGYDATARRAKIHSGVRLAVDRIAREVRHALPNSICTYNGSNCSNSANRVYFLKSTDGGEYQVNSGNYAGGSARAPLPVTPATATSFDVLSTNSLNANANDWVVVYNTNNSAIYSSSSKRKKISSITTKDIDGSAPANDIAVINFASAVSFPGHSPSRRFQIVQNNVTLFYLDGTDLMRATSDFSTPDTPIAPQLLLENVSALSFSYIAGTQQRASVLRIDITVTVNNETVHLVHEAHIQNAA